VGVIDLLLLLGFSSHLAISIAVLYLNICCDVLGSVPGMVYDIKTEKKD
jgi:hypothetical protein